MAARLHRLPAARRPAAPVRVRRHQVHLLSPHPDDPKNSTLAPLVVRLECNGFSVLVAGDCDQHRWESIVYHFGPELRSDALVAPFHGSSKGVLREALD